MRLVDRMLEVDGVVAAYGPVRALDGVDIRVAQGSITAVLGANGAGKTTLLRTVNGLLRAREGRIRLDGLDVTRRRPEDMARLGMAHVPEGRGVVVELTVEENLRLGGLWRPDRARAQAEWRGCTRSSHRFGRAAGSWRRACPAGSARCWPSAGR